MKNKTIYLLLGTSLILSGCGGNAPAPSGEKWNEATLSKINEVFAIESIIPYFNDYQSYESFLKTDITTDYQVITISGLVNEGVDAFASYKSSLQNSSYWTYSESTSSEELVYYSLKNNSFTRSGYLDFYFLDSNFIIEAGLENPPKTAWSEEDLALMDQYIMEGVYLPFYYIKGSYLEECYFEGYSDPQGVSYCSSIEQEEAVNEYATYLQTLPEFELYESHENEFYFKKIIDEETTFYIDVYLFQSYFDSDGYIVKKEVIDAEDNITSDITLLPENFYISAGSEYGVDDLLIKTSGMNYTTTQVKKGYENENAIQFRKGISHFENVNALPLLSSITIDQITEGKGYDGTFSVYGGTSKDELNLIEGVDGVYQMNDATYFKIMDESSYACYARSIKFDFKDLA